MSENKKIIMMPTFWKSFKDTFDPSVWRRIKDFWFDFKWSIKNLIKFRKIVSEFRPWDYNYLFRMFAFQLKQLHDQIELRGMESDETRLPKLEKMKRVLEILNSIEKDDYDERCGYDPKARKISFKKLSDEELKEIGQENQELYEMTMDMNEGYENYNIDKVYKDSEELRKKEWDELFEILKNNLEGWWD